MNVKRLFCLITALILALSLAACEKGSFTDKLNETVNGGNDNTDGDQDNTDGSQDNTDGADGGSLPDYTSFSDGLDENGRFKDVTALDYVTLPDYGSLVIPEFSQVTDRAVEDGDFVNIDYVGSIDGVEFDGGSTGGEGSDIVVGYTSFIDDFIEQLKGHKPGENFDIEVTFPEDYGEETLSGKDAVFNITINYIWDISDEAAQAIGFDDRDDMGQYVAYNYASVDDIVSDPRLDVFLTAAKCDDAPDSVLETIRNQMRLELDLQASQYGLDADTYVSYMIGAPSADEYIEAQAPYLARQYLIVQAVAEKEDIDVTDEDITEYEYESYVEVYGAPYVKFDILRSKVVDLLDEAIG